MNPLAGFSTGVGLGVVSFGSLWWSVNHSLRKSQAQSWLTVGRLARMLLAGVTFYALGQTGVDVLLAALGGFLLARLAFVAR
jgi:F1F0 ATPase subunit 2